MWPQEGQDVIKGDPGLGKAAGKDRGFGPGRHQRANQGRRSDRRHKGRLAVAPAQRQGRRFDPRREGAPKKAGLPGKHGERPARVVALRDGQTFPDPAD